MPSLIIDEAQTEFFYTDSGPPKEDIYTTLVIIHGLSFHSGVFQRILPLAPSKALRLVCLNRRDYPGSTPYSPAELKVLEEGTKDEHVTFLKARGVEIALFLDRLIQTCSIPAPTIDGRSGGLALLGWSLGNVFSLAAIAAASSLPADVQNRLQSYTTRLIIFEPPSLCLGLDDPPNQGYNPFTDSEIPPEQRGAAFVKWVSSYFSHGDLSTHDPNNLTYKSPDPSKESTATGMSPDEFASSVDLAPAVRSENAIFSKMIPLLAQQTTKALYDPDIRALWPRLDVWFIYGTASCWNMIYAAWEIEKREKAAGETRTKFHEINGAHHFVFWDEPERAIREFAHCLQE